MHKNEDIYASTIFFNAALPLLKVIANDVPNLKSKFTGVNAVFQISAIDPDHPKGKRSTCFIIENGEWTVKLDTIHDSPDVEIGFKTIEAMNGFFKGKIAPATLPRKLKGIGKLGLFMAFLSVLLKMSSLLTATEAPKDKETQELMVKCFFYLLSTGISQLNKAGYPAIHDWALKSPDRVYGWAVNGYPSVSAHMRVKEGLTKAGRGEYTKALTFFTLRFDSLESALGILLDTDDMLEAVKAGRLIMDGAPEFGAQIGGFMLEVGALAK
ncbi:MAG: hypothetical protein IJB86_04910 [Clostridia bacterium]|nr:hypothetical protein [Clostridia bacterium]